MPGTGPDSTMAEPYATVTIPAVGSFSLSASTRFLEAFAPAAHDAAADGHLHLAFPVEGDWQPVGACIRQPEPDGDVVADLYSRREQPTATRVAAQLARILSLDVDGSGFADVGDRDRVIADLQAQSPGLRPVCFFSPYEAACWAILSHRVRITQAAAMKQRIADRYGTAISIHGPPTPAFPGPPTLAKIATELDVWDTKRQRLVHLADAALDGQLDAERLRTIPTDEALRCLQRLPGIGPFSSELILLRGAGHPDHMPTEERRLLSAVGELYGIDRPTVDDLRELAENWRPYRTWCAVLIRAWYERQAGR